MIKTYPKSKLFQSDGYWAKEPQQKSYPKSEPSYSEPVIWRWGVSYPATSENKAIPRDDFIGSPNFNRVPREPKDEYADENSDDYDYKFEISEDDYDYNEGCENADGFVPIEEEEYDKSK